MTKNEAKKRIYKLRTEIDHHRYLYHVLDQQEISDGALDSLKHELEVLEDQYPDLITSDSPTQRVGGEPLAKFVKVRHKRRMLSLNDSFSADEITEWEERVKKILPRERWRYFVELKIDGFALELTYHHGVFVRAATRGDGVFGEEVTQNVKTIESVPLKLRPAKKYQLPDEFQVRGEVFMTKKVFAAINKERQAKGEPLYANPRNTAAGSIRQLDPKIAARRALAFLAYEVVTDVGQKTHDEEHALLKEIGFKIGQLDKVCASLEEIFKFYDEIAKKREHLPFQIDGLVAQVNENALRRRLGVVGKAPRGAMAFKFPAEEATTIVVDIQAQVGRTGAITPVAHLKPVVVAGSTVTRATLHNEDEIKRLDVKIGDTVIVHKAGDVIPEIVKVLTKLRTGKEKKFTMPRRCPICGTPTERRAGAVAWYCLNPKCFAQQRERLLHFVSRPAFNIEGLGEKIVGQLINEGLVKDPDALFELTVGDLEPLERFAAKSAVKLVEMIKARQNITLARFIYALGIRYVGEETANLIAARLWTKHQTVYPKLLAKIMNETPFEELMDIEGVGDKVAGAIMEWFSRPANIELLRRLDEVGVTIIKQQISRKLRGKKFVLTGGLITMSREEAKEKIRTRGGDVSGAVSKNIDYVVVGEEPGEKYEQAKKLGVKIISEKEFIRLTSNT